MKFSVVKPGDLDSSLLARWGELQQADGRLASPCFRPEFALAVGEVRGDTRITVIEDSGEVVGFFPFQRKRFGMGKPLASAISDFHGVVGTRELQVPARELLRGSGLAFWEYDHLLAEGGHISGVSGAPCASPVMDLRDGYEAYCLERRESGSEQIKKNGTLARKLEREHGPIEFQFNDPDRDALDRVIEWKSLQCAESGTTDVFGVRWTRELLDRLHTRKDVAFGGVLSTLRAKGKIVAAHFGMRSATRLHYWFPVYDHEFAKYSPGLTLLLRIAEHAKSNGVEAIDLGKGESFYKSRLANAQVPLLEGRIELSGFVSTATAIWRYAEHWVDSGPVARVVGMPIRAIRRQRRLRKYA